MASYHILTLLSIQKQFNTEKLSKMRADIIPLSTYQESGARTLKEGRIRMQEGKKQM